jgi:hypothetical protein
MCHLVISDETKDPRRRSHSGAMCNASLAGVVQCTGTAARGSVGAQMTGPLGNAGLSCARRGGAQQAALRPWKALSRKQARQQRKSDEAVRDWVTLGKCDKGKQLIAASFWLPLAVACSRVWKV